MADDENIRRWVLDEEPVLVKAVATAIGMDGLAKLVAHFKNEGSWLEAAKLEWAAATALPGSAWNEGVAHMKAALALIDEHHLATLEAQQLVRRVYL